MRRIIFPLIALLAVVPLQGMADEPPGPERPPNVILIMADDLGYAELGCYGQAKIETPNIDHLAAGGVRFTRFYAGAPVCAPSRCILLTGRHPGHASIRDNREVGSWNSFRGQLPIADDEVTIAELFKQHGYATGAFGKWGLGEVDSSGDPLNQGFDRFFGYNCQRHAHNYYPEYLISDDRKVPLEGNDRGRTGAQYAPQLIADELLTFIRKHRDEPFFAYYASIIPHLALQAPDEYVERYRGRWDDPPYEGGRGYLPHEHPRAAYAGMVSFLDDQIGRVVALLDELGLSEDTVILFTSDNGPTHGGVGGSDSEFFDSNGPLRGLKGSVYEGGVRVPFIANWSGNIQPGRVSDHVAAAGDLLPTMMDLVGAATPAFADGLSFAPSILGRGEQPVHEYLYWEFHGYGGQQAVRLGDWKAVRNNLSRGDTSIELYNLAKDVGETADLAEEHPDIVARVERIMLEAHEPTEHFRLPVLEELERHAPGDETDRNAGNES